MKLTAYTLASSSRGNSVFISYGNDAILIDAGITCKKIELALRSIGKSLSDLSAILVTHEHTDHICGLPVIAKRCHIPIHMTEPSAREMLKSPKYYPTADYITVHPPIFSLNIGELTVRSFPTPHDSVCSVGYVITAGGQSVGLATDIGHVSKEISDSLYGIENVILESNHDENMLLSGPYPYELKRRILSERGHLSNEAASDFAQKLAYSGTKRIVLAHLSPENNIPELAFATSSLRLTQTDCSVEVAAKEGVTFVCGETESYAFELPAHRKELPC